MRHFSSTGISWSSRNRSNTSIGIPEALGAEAIRLAKRLADELDYVGGLAVEMFVVDGKLLLNEIAPRPHNSGHYTIDACRTSQFEQQVRVLCGLPLGDASLRRQVAAAWEGGVRYYDTAPWYGRGQSEHRIGRLLYRKPRNEVYLSTKVGRVLHAPINPAKPNLGFWAGGLGAAGAAGFAGGHTRGRCPCPDRSCCS